jgi:hypothetical protein
MLKRLLTTIAIVGAKIKNPQHYLLGPMTRQRNKTCYTPLKIGLNAMSKIRRVYVP